MTKIAKAWGEMTPQERLREWREVYNNCDSGPDSIAAVLGEAADALDAQAERIKALEGALRDWLRVDEIGRDPNTHRESFAPMKREIVDRARALLGEK